MLEREAASGKSGVAGFVVRIEMYLQIGRLFEGGLGWRYCSPHCKSLEQKTGIPGANECRSIYGIYYGNLQILLAEFDRTFGITGIVASGDGL